VLLAMGRLVLFPVSVFFPRSSLCVFAGGTVLRYPNVVDVIAPLLLFSVARLFNHGFRATALL